MRLLAAFAIFSCFVAAHSLDGRSVDFHNPVDSGGSMLDNAGSGGGEPLNVIVSRLSSPAVLTNDGFLNYARAIGFSSECFGIHLGNPQSANLGDGNGWVNQTLELRQDYGNAGAGTCLESLIGGNHFRIFRQDGPYANTGALFLAVSREEPVTKSHTIIPDGYNIGRNNLVASATGITTYNGVTYGTVAQNLTGLLMPGSQGINHGKSAPTLLIVIVNFSPGIVQDGIVTLLTVHIVRSPSRKPDGL
ncbi:hypothetical protein AX17_005827 [Amanita inopinata Kibby_2008]|nr:hypothetical protein AX17_005827 [Amanita inopinata Kibby_2008]